MDSSRLWLRQGDTLALLAGPLSPPVAPAGLGGLPVLVLPSLRAG